jgi:multidrug resistance efflux pump
MNALEPIPIPLHVKWRDFRERRLPLLVFCLVSCAAFFIWRQVGSTPTLIGIGEGNRAIVMSPLNGWLGEVLVQPYQVVKKGDPIAVLKPVDPGAKMDLMRLEMEIARIRQQPTVQEQNAVGYERARMECLRLRSELAIARAKLEHAEKDVQRNQPLFQQKLVSEQAHELHLRERDVCRAEVADKSKAVAEMEGRLHKLRALGDPFLLPPSITSEAFAQRLDGERADLQTNWLATIVRAPMDGMTGATIRQIDEFVFEGEIIVTIDSLHSERIIGYLRQPYLVDPERGMAVSVATRTRKRQSFTSMIVQVGAQCEYITNSLAVLRPYSPIDMGLPIVMDIPPGVRIRPGEQVDLVLHPNTRER